jgi:hypothetical protein
MCVEEKSFRLCWGSNLNRPAVQPVARHYNDSYPAQYNGSAFPNTKDADQGTKLFERTTMNGLLIAEKF